MGCQVTTFLVKYLGIPVTVRKLPSEPSRQLVDQIAGCLPYWKAGMMTGPGQIGVDDYALS